jgi:hypothetical protein
VSLVIVSEAVQCPSADENAVPNILGVVAKKDGDFDALGNGNGMVVVSGIAYIGFR